MSRSLELPDDVYGDLERAARRDGLTPADWIASTLAGRSSAPEQRPLDELLKGLLGVVDSTDGAPGGTIHTPFGDLIASKLEKQGLRRA
jgi:hypothetical protein